MPRTIGEFRILRPLGEGGMGTVYLAYREGRGEVALKVLSDHLANNQTYVDRFYREARNAFFLNHPNIVRGLDVGKDRATGKPYLVLEYVDGWSALALVEQQGRLPLGDAVHIALDIARALEYAHAHNVIHRDIKPDNILVTRSGLAKLTDLGLAKRTDEISHLTATRQTFGTPHYMPYEQAINVKHADHRSDIYALGGTLYHLLAGQVPFPADNHLDVIDLKSRGNFEPASQFNPAVPPDLDRILSRMLARHPKDRYQTISEVIVDLERTELAAPVPSFADPTLAFQDPVVRARLVAIAQPTQLDMEVVARQKKAAGAESAVWYLLSRDGRGSTRTVRATTRQIARQLRTGRISGKVKASPREKGEYLPLSVYPEFRELTSDTPRPPKRRRRTPDSEPEQHPKPPSSQVPVRWRWWLLGAAGLGVLSALGAIALAGS